MTTIHWINGQAGGTPLSAENLNLMQQYINNYIDAQIQATQENEGNRYVTGQEYATKDKLDGKTIYFRRYYWNSLGDNTRTAKPLGILLDNIEIFEIGGHAYSNTGNVFTLSNESLEGQGASALKLTLYRSDNTIGVETCNANFVRGKAYANLYYTKNSEVTE